MTINNVHFDELIKSALQEPCEPSQELIQSVRAMISQGIIPARRRKHNATRKLLIAALITVMVSGTALAIRLLRPMDEIAEILFGKEIENVFSSENAVVIDRCELSGDYMITLMGIAPTDKLDALNKGDENMTYAVIAISKTDGTPMPEMQSAEFSPLYATPFIKGVPPWHAGVDQIQGSTVIEGTLYLLLGCDNLEIYADKGVYLGISDRPFFSHDTYVYDDKTGDFYRNENYSGVNVLFELPLDATKADTLKAGAITSEPVVEPHTEPKNEIDPESTTYEPKFESSHFRIDMPLEERIALTEHYMSIPLDECTLVEDSVEVCVADADGYVSYRYNGDGVSTSLRREYQALFETYAAGETIRELLITAREVYIVTYTLGLNDSVTFSMYLAYAMS